jgi:hypothetical protein
MLNTGQYVIETNNAGHVWNVNAPDFCAPASKAYKDMDTQTEQIEPTTVSASSQTDQNIEKVDSGTQCEKIVTKCKGVSCKMHPATKTTHVQATVSVTNQGSGCSTLYQEAFTQVDSLEIKTPTVDRSVWINQSPGAKDRHTQTEKHVMNRRTNTDPVGTTVSTTSTGTQTQDDSQKSQCGSHQKGAKGTGGPETTPLVGVGPSGLASLLTTLGVKQHNRDELATDINVQDKNRNVKAHGIIEIEGTEVKDSYWAIFDDIGVLIQKDGLSLAAGRYAKLYGKCEVIMNEGKRPTIYKLVEGDSRLFHRCEKIGKSELDTIRSHVRLKQPSWDWTGGHGYGYTRDDYNDEYADASRYDSYGSGNINWQ